jgi:hypothetical protein
MSAKRAILLLLASVLVLLLVDEWFSHLSFAESVLGSDLTAIQAKQVEIYVQVTQQLFTLATLMLAGVGLFTPERETHIRGSVWPLVLVATFTAFSMYFGYLSLNATVWMLSKNFFNLQTPVLHYLRLAQFWTFGASVFLFAWFWLKRSTLWRST